MKTILQIKFYINFISCFDVSGVTVLLAITVFATIVTDTLPASNSIPLIGQNKIMHHYAWTCLVYYRFTNKEHLSLLKLFSYNFICLCFKRYIIQQF